MDRDPRVRVRPWWSGGGGDSGADLARAFGDRRSVRCLRRRPFPARPRPADRLPGARRRHGSDSGDVVRGCGTVGRVRNGDDRLDQHHLHPAGAELADACARGDPGRPHRHERGDGHRRRGGEDARAAGGGRAPRPFGTRRCVRRLRGCHAARCSLRVAGPGRCFRRHASGPGWGERRLARNPGRVHDAPAGTRAPPGRASARLQRHRRGGPRRAVRRDGHRPPRDRAKRRRLSGRRVRCGSRHRCRRDRGAGWTQAADPAAGRGSGGLRGTDRARGGNAHQP